MDILRSVTGRTTPQSEKADPRQVRNTAGGFTFTVDPVTRVRRFLVLGTQSGTFYATARQLTIENAQAVVDLATTDHRALVDTIVDVSVSGAAPRVQPALFALAIAASHGTDDERRQALAALPTVARTGTHLFLFAGYVEQFRGWGRGLRRAVADWYTERPVDEVAFQAVKYRQREGWSHRDLVRLAHPVTTDPARKALFEWIVRGKTDEHTPRIVRGWEAAQQDGADLVRLIEEFGLTWEMLPGEALDSTAVWATLFDRGLPQTALIRQLPRLTRLGLFEPLATAGTRVAARLTAREREDVGPLLPQTDRLAAAVAQLTDRERLRRARVHPMSVLVALRTYANGRSWRGRGTWEPVPQVIDALDAAFYAAFDTVVPSGRRTLVALDVSGSMMTPIADTPLSARDASAAMALVTVATEPATHVIGFTGGRTWPEVAVTPLPISPRQRLDDVIRTVSGLPFGPTDCALPMLYALDRGLAVDTFVIYTDNETWYGNVHPHQALRRYRERTGIAAKLVVVAMTATDFTIADPTDAGMLDVVGFDPAVPGLIADFARG